MSCNPVTFCDFCSVLQIPIKQANEDDYSCLPLRVHGLLLLLHRCYMTASVRVFENLHATFTGFPRFIGWFPTIFGWFPSIFGGFPYFFAFPRIFGPIVLIYNRKIPINYGNEPKIYGIRPKIVGSHQKITGTDQ